MVRGTRPRKRSTRETCSALTSGQTRVPTAGTRRGCSRPTLSACRTRPRGDTKRRGSAPPAGTWRFWLPGRMRDWGVTTHVSQARGIEPTDFPRRTSWRRISKSRTPLTSSPARMNEVAIVLGQTDLRQRVRSDCGVTFGKDRGDFDKSVQIPLIDRFWLRFSVLASASATSLRFSVDSFHMIKASTADPASTVADFHSPVMRP